MLVVVRGSRRYAPLEHTLWTGLSLPTRPAAAADKCTPRMGEAKNVPPVECRMGRVFVSQNFPHQWYPTQRFEAERSCAAKKLLPPYSVFCFFVVAQESDYFELGKKMCRLLR